MLTQVSDWQPYCGELYPLEKIAGDPVICDREPHDEETKHLNSELRFEWWLYAMVGLANN